MEGNTVPRSRGTRKFIASEESQGRKPEPTEDRAGLKTRIFSSPCSPYPSPGFLPQLQLPRHHPSPQYPPSYHNSTKVQLGNFRVGVQAVPLAPWPLLTVRYPVPVPQPAVPPGEGPGHAGQAGKGAARVSTRPLSGSFLKDLHQ